MKDINLSGFRFRILDNGHSNCYYIPGHIHIENETQYILQLIDFCKKLDITVTYERAIIDCAFITITFTKKKSNGQRRIRERINTTVVSSRVGFESLFKNTIEKLYDRFVLADETIKQEGEEMDNYKELLNSFYGLNSPHAFSFSNGWCYKHEVDIRSLIKKVIFNDPATIIIWKDDTKTIVKCGENDKYDPEKGLAMAIAKKCLGDKGNYYETFKKYLPVEDKEDSGDEK